MFLTNEAGKFNKHYKIDSALLIDKGISMADENTKQMLSHMDGNLKKKMVPACSLKKKERG
ncbi:hypothetical protein ACQCVH_23180 [Bacillus infantis]|uniref:hypothetical protein n=1 Tax=Bacillus infantis TaxID=324767 RepID=UPI003CEF9E35